MARSIFDECDPSTKSGANSLKAKRSNCNLDQFDQNETDVLDSVQLAHDQIIHSGGKDEDFLLKVFNALDASSKEDFIFLSRKA